MNLLKKMFRNNEESSKNVAKQRLQFVLVQDKIKLSPDDVKNLKIELLKVFEKYVKIDTENVEMKIDRVDNEMALSANFPVLNK